MLFNERNNAIKVFMDYSSMVFEAKNEAEGKDLKIITPKQILQILPIAPEQVKAGNTSENLLNELLQLIYSLYQAKEITEKVYDKTMNSIKL